MEKNIFSKKSKQTAEISWHFFLIFLISVILFKLLFSKQADQDIVLDFYFSEIVDGGSGLHLHKHWILNFKRILMT